MKKVGIFFILILLLVPQQRACAEEALMWADCLAEAKKNNPDLISASENINQQKAGKTITASSLFPQINASADATRQKTSSSAGSTSSSSKNPATNSYSYGVSGSQLIFDGFKTINNINAANENINAAGQNYRFVSSQVRLDLRGAFVRLLKAQELIRVTEEIVKIRKDNLDLISLRYESGLEHKGALLTAEANLAQANSELSAAKRNIEFAKRQLSKEMGQKEFSPMRAKGEFVVADAAAEKPDFEEIVKNNPSLLQAAAKKSSAAYGVKSAYGNFSPQLTGTAGANRTDSSWPPQNDRWNIGLSLSVPIFEGGLRLAQVSQAKSIYRQAEEDARSIKDAAVVSLEQTWASLRDAIENIDVQLKYLEATQERSNIAQAQYSTGFITFDNWIIIENDLVGAKRAYLETQANALLAEANWVQAKGETLEYAQ